MSKRILCPKCGKKPDVQEIHFDNMLLRIWCRDCGSVPMEIQLEPPKTDYAQQESKKLEAKQRSREKKKTEHISVTVRSNVHIKDLPLALRKKLGYRAL